MHGLTGDSAISNVAYKSVSMVLLISIGSMLLLRAEPDELALFATVEYLHKHGLTEFLRNYNELHWIGDQHPPLPVVVSTVTAKVFGEPQVWSVRLPTTILNLLTCYLTFLIARDLFSVRVGLLSVILLVAMPFFTRFGALASNDAYITCFCTASALVLLRLERSTKAAWRKPALSIILGIVIGIGLLCKYTMVLIYGFNVLFWFITIMRWRHDRTRISDPNEAIWLFFMAVFLPFLISMCLFCPWLLAMHKFGILQVQLEKIAWYLAFSTANGSAEIATIGEEGSSHKSGIFFSPWYPQVLLQMTLVRLPSAIGVYCIPLLAIAVRSFWRDRSDPDIRSGAAFLVVWVVTLSLPIILTLPVARYLMPIFPALCIAMSRGADVALSNPAPAVVISLICGITTLLLYISIPV